MCEICLQFRCPTACPSYEKDRRTPSGRGWKFRRTEWELWERNEEEKKKEIENRQENSKEIRMKQGNKEKEEKNRNGKTVGF